MTDQQRASDIYGILLDASSPCVLMLRGAAGDWTLPHFHVPDKRVWMPHVGVACGGLRDVLAAEITVLRTVYAQYSADRLHVDLIYMLENHSEGWTPPPPAKWVERGELAALALACPDHRAVIEEVLREAATDHVPGLRPSWARPGWFQAALTWVREQLSKHEYTITGPTEQIKSWGISCLLRTPTDRGSVFFKESSTLPLFGNEPVLLKALAERYPDAVPAPIAIQPSRRWMLMGDFGPELRSTPTLEKVQTAVQRFGQLQLQSVPEVESLLKMGCLDRRLDVLAAQIDPLLNDEEALAPMTAEERTRLRSLGPRLKAMCSELAAYHVPQTLNHGDLHSGNITGETLRFFDWTDACLAHPFLDLATVMQDVEEYLPGQEARVLERYFDLWSAYEPVERLREMWQLAEPLGALHQAVSYQHILATLEPSSKREMVWGVPEWLRRALRAMPA